MTDHELIQFRIECRRAIKLGKFDELCAILDNSPSADIDDVGLDDEGSLLAFAVLWARPEAVDILLDHGADPKNPGDEPWPAGLAIQMASSENEESLVILRTMLRYLEPYEQVFADLDVNEADEQEAVWATPGELTRRYPDALPTIATWLLNNGNRIPLPAPRGWALKMKRRGR